jgi:16S rRNA (guanine1516-N2)-methyltransferase
MDPQLLQKYHDYQFFYQNGELAFKSPDFNDNENPICSTIDLHYTKFMQQFKRVGHKREPLSRSLGSKRPEIITDATFGMGGDSMYFLAMGLEVIAFEREPLIFLMHKLKIDYLSGHNKAYNRINLKLGSCLNTENVELIYFDPMYSDHNEKALPGKNMRIFRSLIGSDADSEEVATQLRSKCYKLVIKRPIKAPLLLSTPTNSFKGKSTRYDVYLNH